MLRDTILTEMKQWHIEHDIDAAWHRGQQAAAHYYGRLHEVRQIRRHTVLHRPKIVRSMADKFAELHLLCYAQNGSALAAYCHSQINSGSTRAKLAEHILRLFTFDTSIKKYLVVDGPELVPLIECNITGLRQCPLMATAGDRLDELRLVTREQFLTHYSDFTMMNQC